LMPAEDSLDLDETPAGQGDVLVDIAVVRLPRIANFDDFEWLAAEPGVRVRWITTAAALADADLVVLPGSKSVVADLAWLRERGLAAAIVGAAGAGRPVLGVCGGYQMLGRTLRDPDRVESDVAVAPGLGLLPVETTFARQKTTHRVRARATGRAGLFAGAHGVTADAYEIHAGITRLLASDVAHPFALVERGGVATDQPDGAAVGAVCGTYLHGVLADGEVRRALLGWLASRAGRAAHAGWGSAVPRLARWDRLADIVAGALDVAAIGKLVGRPL
jgi:adenosylcobyric acid synthase